MQARGRAGRKTARPRAQGPASLRGGAGRWGHVTWVRQEPRPACGTTLALTDDGIRQRKSG